MYLRVKKWFVLLLPCVLAAVLAVHFAMTALYLLPLNPLKLRYGGTVISYMEPIFTQKWSLFAPEPLTVARVLLVRCKGPDGAVSTWEDVTSPLMHDKWSSRFTPSDRLLSAEYGAVAILLGPEEELLQRLRKHPERFAEPIATLDRVSQERREAGARMLGRIASERCDHRFGIGRTASVQVRLVLIHPPPFSARLAADETGERQVTELSWMPHEQVSAR